MLSFCKNRKKLPLCDYIIFLLSLSLPPSLPQITTYLPLEVDMVFEVGMFSATLSVGGERFTSELTNRINRFDQRFEQTFQLKAKVKMDYYNKFDSIDCFFQGFDDSEIDFAKATFSNLIGGISYFYGQSK